MAAATSVHVVAVIEPIIQHADWFFPEGEWLSGCADGKAAGKAQHKALSPLQGEELVSRGCAFVLWQHGGRTIACFTWFTEHWGRSLSACSEYLLGPCVCGETRCLPRRCSGHCRSGHTGREIVTHAVWWMDKGPTDWTCPESRWHWTSSSAALGRGHLLL